MLSGEKLNKILPQANPMLMIDKLLVSDAEKTITNLTVKKSNIFTSDGCLKEPGIIENMAQTAASRAGYKALKENVKVRTGFIGSIKNLVIYTLPKVDNILQTTLVPVSDIGNISVVTTEVMIEKKKIAECTMTIILLD